MSFLYGKGQVFQFLALNFADRRSKDRIMFRRPCNLFVEMPMNSPFNCFRTRQNRLTTKHGRNQSQQAASNCPYPH